MSTEDPNIDEVMSSKLDDLTAAIDSGALNGETSITLSPSLISTLCAALNLVADYVIDETATQHQARAGLAAVALVLADAALGSV